MFLNRTVTSIIAFVSCSGPLLALNPDIGGTAGSLDNAFDLFRHGGGCASACVELGYWPKPKEYAYQFYYTCHRSYRRKAIACPICKNRAI